MKNKLLCFQKEKLKNFKILFITSFLLYFFSNSLIYSYSIQKNDYEYLTPIGNVIQIDAELKNIVVRNYAEGSPFLVGDSLIAINEKSINNYGDYSDIISELPSNSKLSVLILRNNNKLTIETNKQQLQKLNINGLLSGFATLTYINPATGDFRAVAHPISIGSTKKIPVKTGTISTTTDLDIQKSKKGTVGSVNAKRKDTIGKFNINNDFGIKGKISNFDISDFKSYKIASYDEIKIGKAQILLQSDSDKCELFDIQITDIQRQRSPQSKSFKIKITDTNLLRKTGGIVQGMSGTPIIQNDKIIGAISHAVENDPSVGYAVYIKWMINN